jgi:hypothetical protein
LQSGTGGEHLLGLLKEIDGRSTITGGQRRQSRDSQAPLQRLKTYRQLYAWGCRIDRIECSIERLGKPRG